jgi:hypothetical protein
MASQGRPDSGWMDFYAKVDARGEEMILGGVLVGARPR